MTKKEEAKPAIEPSVHDLVFAELEKLGAEHYIAVMLLDNETNECWTFSEGSSLWHYDALMDTIKRVVKKIASKINGPTKINAAPQIKEDIVESMSDLMEFVKAELDVSAEESKEG